MTGMRAWGRTILAALLVFAVGCATLAAYICSILWRGGWKYPELLNPICVFCASVQHRQWSTFQKRIGLLVEQRLHFAAELRIARTCLRQKGGALLRRLGAWWRRR
jgi:hypothetical protein